MLKIKEYPLPDNEYYKETSFKNSIVLHHTAGGHRPDWTIEGWKKDRTKKGIRLKVGTAFIIGNLSTTSDETEYDGYIYQAFDPEYWAHHLGVKKSNNVLLNKQSIAIEICSYGPLTKTKSGEFLNYVNKPVPKEMVTELETPFRGFKHYHTYSKKQIESLKILLHHLSATYNIDLRCGLKENITADPLKAFELKWAPLRADYGLWTHGNFRSDKFDCYPDPGLIEMVKEL